MDNTRRSININKLKWFSLGIAVSVLVFLLAGQAFAATAQKQATLEYLDIWITVDGNLIIPKDASGAIVEPFVIDGTTYLPVRAVADALDLGVNWNAYTNTVELTSNSGLSGGTPNTSPGTSQNTENWYNPAFYEVGQDIPSGELYLECTGFEKGYIVIYSDLSRTNVLFSNDFENHSFITLEKGQFLELKMARAIEADKINERFSYSNLPKGLYRVGIDIPAGDYTLQQSSSLPAYYCIYDSSTIYQTIVTNKNFEKTIRVSVEDGDYLYLNRCSGYKN